MRSFLRRVRQALARRLDPMRSVPLEELEHAPDLFHAFRQFASDPRLKRKPGGWEYKGRFYPDYLTVGGASQAIAREALRYCRGGGLDVGAGLWPLPGATAVDLRRGSGAGRALEDFADGSQDFIFSSHCLEHVEDWRAELARWVAKVRRGGMLFLYLPHPECGLWEPSSPMVGTEHKWQPTPAIVKDALAALGCSLVACDEGPDAMMSFYVAARRS